MFTFNHFNFNVKNLEDSLRFYDEALGLKPCGKRKPLTAAIKSSSWVTVLRIFALS